MKINITKYFLDSASSVAKTKAGVRPNRLTEARFTRRTLSGWQAATRGVTEIQFKLVCSSWKWPFTSIQKDEKFPRKMTAMTTSRTTSVPGDDYPLTHVYTEPRWRVFQRLGLCVFRWNLCTWSYLLCEAKQTNICNRRLVEFVAKVPIVGSTSWIPTTRLRREPGAEGPLF